jgi:hypothetical protein
MQEQVRVIGDVGIHVSLRDFSRRRRLSALLMVNYAESRRDRDPEVLIESKSVL